MAFGIGRHGARGAAILSASTALAMTLSMTAVASAQTGSPSATETQSVNFSIPAQPLSSALNSFARTTGWQLGYQSALVSGRRSASVNGQLAPLNALRAILAGTGISVRVTGPRTVSLVENVDVQAPGTDGTTVLEAITLKSARAGVTLGTDSVADTGTSTLSGGQLTGRIDGNDANGALRNLPNVQYQNDASDDAGVTDLSVIDLRPREVSISGARVYENNFILNGIGINDVTGSQEGYGSATEGSLSDTGLLSESRMHGLHSQTIYVPGDFVSEVTLSDSNVSAKYGDFQGGVVSYKMMDANRERLSGSVSTEYTTSDWAGFHVATEDGLNPLEVKKQEYLERRVSAALTGPITDNVAVLGQYSKQTAETQKPRYPQYVGGGIVPEDSSNEFYRGQLIADTDIGEFTLEGFYTDYNMYWEPAAWRELRMNLAKDAFSSKLQHDYEFEDFSLGGIDISNLKLTSKLTYGRSKSINDGNGTVAGVITTTRNNIIGSVSDWCRAITGDGKYTNCYYGALGDLYQSQEQTSWSQELKGDVFNGSFLLGGDYTYTVAERARPEDVTYYVAYANARDTTFVCGTSNLCNADMYASTRQIRPAFDASANMGQFNAYAEIEQEWRWLHIRAGARVSYNDYMNNLDLAPRVVGTITPVDDLSISAGFGRYYNATSLAFAIRDQQPRRRTYQRIVNGGIVSDDWRYLSQLAPNRTLADDLSTPYSDELTFGISGKEPLFGGDWRLRYLHRSSKDQFAAERTNANYFTVTNDGYGNYQSATAEYSKEFDATFVPKLDKISFNTSITWSKKEISNNSYYESDLEDEYIWYNNASYTEAGFGVVTGNNDIPLRFQAGISTAWFDSRFLLDISGNYNFAYRGVKNTDTSIIVGGQQHTIWEDFDFDPTFTVDLSGKYVVYENDDTRLNLNFKVSNLFDEKGNATANIARPWVIGRTVWVGATAAF